MDEDSGYELLKFCEMGCGVEYEVINNIWDTVNAKDINHQYDVCPYMWKNDMTVDYGICMDCV